MTAQGSVIAPLLSGSSYLLGSMFSRYSGGVCCLALLVFTLLPLVACAGSSTSVDVHVVSETATDSRSYFPVRPYERRAAGPVKQRAAAVHRLLYGCLPGILAAVVVVLLVLRCAWVVGLKTRPEPHGRAFAEGWNKDVLGVCGANLGGEDAKAPSEDREAKTAEDLEERVTKVLEAIEDLTAIVEEAWQEVCPLQALMMVVRLQSTAILELGSLASLLEKPLEQERKDAARKVVDLSYCLLETPKGGRPVQTNRYRLREQLAVLKAVKRNDFPPSPLDAASRRAKLKDLVQVQEEILEMVKALLSEMASFKEYFEKVPSTGPHKALGDLFHIRKIRLLQDPVFQPRFMWFQESSRKPVLLSPGKEVGGPAPSTSEQIRELRAVFVRAQSPETQEPQTASVSQPGPSDVSVPSQRPGDGSASSLPTHHGSVHQAALSLQSLSIGAFQTPGIPRFPGRVRPPRKFSPRSSTSWHQRGQLPFRVFLPSGPHFAPAPAAPRQPLSATGAAFFPRVRPAPGATHGQVLPSPAPSPFTSSSRPPLPSPSSMHQVPPAAASSPLSPHARPFFPLTTSSVPGAHRWQHPFYGEPQGMPPAAGYSADSGPSGESYQEPQRDSKDQT